MIGNKKGNTKIAVSCGDAKCCASLILTRPKSIKSEYHRFNFDYLDAKGGNQRSGRADYPGSIQLEKFGKK
jgi:hypothetical protein